MQPAHAQSLFETLVMPGQLVTGHAKLESGCKNCHDTSSKQPQSALCAGCHKPVRDDIARKTGFHGRSPAVANKDCKTCHTDHKGRTAEIVGLDPETFRHSATDFQLSGAHGSVACNACHKEGKPHRDTSSQCSDCHEAKDPHKGKLGTVCEGCHTDVAWAPQKPFDHNKTKFRLTGGHRTVGCTTCHANEQWKGIDMTCLGCHASRDVHQGRNGKACESCHGTDKWKTVKFDHAKTKFPLRGAHETVACTACHKTNITDKLPLTCVGCHKSQDPHKGGLGAKCEGCHSEASWRQVSGFDHDLISFPLIGLHSAVPCESCHTNNDFKKTPARCSGCHRDTAHSGSLGPRCEGCHTPNGWALWTFNHDLETKFALTGAHSGLACAECHKGPDPKAVASSDCYTCHARDDKHEGTFGRSCGACHDTTSFANPMRRQ